MQKSLRIFIGLLIFSLLFIDYFHTITAITQDLGRHIKTGEIIVTAHSIPKTNVYSYTYPNFPFINHHWLSEVVFYLVFQSFGYLGLLLVGTATILMAFGTLFYYCAKRYSFLSLTIVSLLAIKILFERTDLRPELFSFLFFSIFLTTLFSYREHFSKKILFLIPLQLLWTNMHIYFLIGPIVLLFFCIDIFISYIKKGVAEGKDVRKRGMRIFAGRQANCGSKKMGMPSDKMIRLLFVFISCSLITLLNPNFLSGALYPLHVFDNYGYSVEENQNIFFLWEMFQKPTIVFFWITFIAVFTTFLLTIKKVRIIDWLLAIFFSYLAITNIRNFPLFALAIFIPFTHHANTLLNFLIKRSQPKISVSFLLLLVFISLLFIKQQFDNPLSNKTFGYSLDSGASEATQFFLDNNLKGPIFNNFDIGSYLIYRLYPKEKVFVDGRPEAYPASFFQKIYIPMQQDPSLFEKVDKTYHFNTIFFSHTDQTPWAQMFLKTMIKNPAWKTAYIDNYVIIFVRNNEQNKNILEKLPSDPKQTVHYTIDSLYSLANYALLFQSLGFGDLEEKVFRDMLTKSPDYCPALYNLTALLTQKNAPAAAIYASSFRTKCQ